jgi:pyridoxine kinase
VLSIQSSVAYGHVGNSAAVFPLQRLGHEVVPVLTVHFSNHTGYGAWRGPRFSATTVREVLLGIEELGVLAGVDLVLTGYLGDPEVVEVVLDAVERVRAANPRASYACDPVIGDAHTGPYVDPALPPLLRDRVVPRADLVTPNQFELGVLTGLFDGAARRPSFATLLDAADAVRRDGPATVLVTSVDVEGQEPEETGMVVVGATGRWRVRTPRLDLLPSGSGDVTAALFATHLLETGDHAESLARTASSIFDLLARTAEAGSEELLLVAGQDAFVQPRHRFEAEPIA